MRVGRKPRVAALLGWSVLAAWPVVGATAPPVQRFPVREKIAADAPIRLTVMSRYETGIFGRSAAEIVDYSPEEHRLFISNAAANQIDVVEIEPSGGLVPLAPIALDPYGPKANSLAISGGFLAVAVEAADPQSPGRVVVFETNGRYRAKVTVGPMPDMLTFSPDDRWLLVANEGEPNDDYTVDPEGSVSVIDCRRGAGRIRQQDVRLAGFGAIAPESLDAKVRIRGPGANIARDLEPEYVAVSPDSQVAFVSLQENNAVAVVDVPEARVRSILPLGTRDFARPGFGLDPSARDGRVAIRSWPVEGLYQPDGIAAYVAAGKLYFVTANEGDPRTYPSFDEEVRLEHAPWADTIPKELREKTALGRLKVSASSHPVIETFGARSFAIWTAEGARVFESGEDFERITAEVLGYENFNRDHMDAGVESRSEERGPEPEGVTLASLGERTFAIIGLERAGGVMVYDVSVPREARFVQYINPRDWSGDPAAGTAGDLGPEGLHFIPAAESPTGGALLAVANEVSGSLTLYRIEEVRRAGAAARRQM